MCWKVGMILVGCMAASNTGDQHMAEKDPDMLSLNEIERPRLHGGYKRLAMIRPNRRVQVHGSLQSV